jgi:uncharacterized membrane protein YjfL (UPF0719 family)
MLFDLLGQGLPPIPTSTTGFNFVNFILNAVAALLWSVVAAVIFTLVVIIAMRMFSALTPGINELAELKNGNIAVALVMFGFLVSVALVVMAVLVGG